MKKIFLSFMVLLASISSHTQNPYTDSLKGRLTAAKDPLEKFSLLNKISEGLFSGNSQKVDSAVCLQMLEIAQDLRNDSLLAISYDWVGNYFSWTSNFNSALEYFLKGVPVAARINDKRRLSSLYIDISMVFNSINNPAEEFHYISLANDNLPDKSSPMFPFMNIQVKTLLSKYYLASGRPDSALHYAQQVTEINLQLKSLFFEAVANALTAGTYEQLGKADLSDLYFKKAVAAEDSGYRYLANTSPKTMYTGFLIRHNNLQSAKLLALDCLTGSRFIGSTEYGKTAAGYLQEIYHMLGNPDSAYYYSRLESQLRDSAFSQEKIYRLQSLAFAEQLRMRDEDLKKQKAEEQRRREIQYLVIGIVIIGLSLFFLLISHSIIANESIIRFIGIISLLVVFEFVNLLIHPFLEKITHHNSIFMLLSLVCLAALLIPLHHRLEKWAVHKLVEKNKKIRLAAAKKTIAKLENPAGK